MPDRIIWQILARAVGGLVILSGLAWPGRAPAQAAEDFYRGKTLRLVVGSDVSGEYDATARLLVRHLPDHVPGHPSIIVQNMPGASGIKSAIFLPRSRRATAPCWRHSTRARRSPKLPGWQTLITNRPSSIGSAA